MVLIEIIAGTFAAALSGVGVYYYCSQENVVKSQHKRLTKQNYLHERYFEIASAALKLESDGMVYVFAKNPAQISGKAYDGTVQEVVGDYNLPSGNYKIVYDKTAYSVEFKSQDIQRLVEEAGLTASVDSYGVYIEKLKRQGH